MIPGSVELSFQAVCESQKYMYFQASCDILDWVWRGGDQVRKTPHPILRTCRGFDTPYLRVTRRS